MKPNTVRFFIVNVAMAVMVVAQPALSQQPGNAPGEASSLLFRAIVRDENHNQIIHAGETIVVEMEIKNEGPGEVSGVEVLINGTPELVEKFPGALPIGSLTPGEVRHLSIEGKAGAVKHSIPGELTLTLRSRSSLLARVPSVKKFPVSLKPEEGAEIIAESVNVDTIPAGSARLKQPAALGIAVGIGRFRDSALPRVKYAAQDAEVVAKYLSQIGGIPQERIRQLVDGHALKSDLAEVFEDWLPKQIAQDSVVYVYMSGRAVVEPESGDVAIVPYDASGNNGIRVYSLKRVRDILMRLPIPRAIVILDISLEVAPSSSGKTFSEMFWDRTSNGGDKIMWMVGNRSVQEAHAYEPARHGLFTYQLLQGLGGAADLDKNGTIIAGELCTYTKGRVATMAKEVFGNEQEPFCLPDIGQEALVRGHPMASFE